MIDNQVIDLRGETQKIKDRIDFIHSLIHLCLTFFLFLKYNLSK